MKRRRGACLLLLAVALLAPAGDASAQDNVKRVAVLGPAEEPRFGELVRGLRRGLTERGYPAAGLEMILAPVTRGDQSGSRAAVESFVRQGAHVLFAIGSELARAARQVSADMPVVFITPGDPVAAGLVASLARPGGNMTAMTFEFPELSGKRLELLKELSPRVQRVLVLHDPRDASPEQAIAAARLGARRLGAQLIERETRSDEDIARGLQALSEADAVLAIPGGMTSAHYRAIIRAATAAKVPSFFHARTQATSDALASYGASDAGIAREAARLVDKVLAGENAGNLPVERPTKFELTINLRTARAIGLDVAPTLLARADEVIE